MGNLVTLPLYAVLLLAAATLAVVLLVITSYERTVQREVDRALRLENALQLAQAEWSRTLGQLEALKRVREAMEPVLEAKAPVPPADPEPFLPVATRRLAEHLRLEAATAGSALSTGDSERMAREMLAESGI